MSSPVSRESAISFFLHVAFFHLYNQLIVFTFFFILQHLHLLVFCILIFFLIRFSRHLSLLLELRWEKNHFHWRWLPKGLCDCWDDSKIHGNVCDLHCNCRLDALWEIQQMTVLKFSLIVVPYRPLNWRSFFCQQCLVVNRLRTSYEPVTFFTLFLTDVDNNK